MALNYKSDILIIGTGGAGLRAAIEAEASGAHVILVSKAPAGYNNCTIVAGSGYLAAVGGMSVEEHLERTLSVGKGVNDPKLVKVLTEEGGERVLELEKYGCVVNVRHGGIHVGDKDTILGQGITLPKVKYIRDKGVEIVENTIITKLHKEGDRVVGAVGYCSDKKTPVIFQSKAVILASGGAGALFKRTDCPLKTTGDGYSLAYHTGVRLRDMEFCQFFPLALAEPCAPKFLVNGPLIWEGKIINSLGEDIPAKHGVTERPYIAKSRDLLSRAMMKEILSDGGLDGAVLVDAREVVKRGNEDEFHGMANLAFYRDRLKAHERPFRVAPVSHFTMGGVVSNTYGETDVKGLFAVGEVMGGVHGANRHGGNALTDVTVFGARAGARATEYVKKVDHVDVEEKAAPELERYKRMAKRETGYTPPTIMNLLRETMWENAGIIRDSYSLVDAYEKVAELRDTATKVMAQHGRQMLAALEVPMALNAAEMIIRAAMMRRESRGAHYREDYPEMDPEWVKTVIISKKGEAMQLGTVVLGEAFE
ncbi:MAG: FAD-binding protein [Candidatus Bathyarchaeota archaeon]|nr:FAD-binding protein [Candidatus Bathyarchaeota archaeon]